MSYDLFNWAKSQRMTGVLGVSRATAKLVLITMAGTAKPHYFGSISTLAKETELDRKTIFRAINSLLSAGFLIDSGNRRGVTRRIVEYHFSLPKVIHKESQSRNSSESGIVPNKQSPISPGIVPNFPINSPKLGILKQEGKQEGNSSHAGTHTRPDAREGDHDRGKKKSTGPTSVGSLAMAAMKKMENI